MRKKPMLTLLSTAVMTAVAALSVPTTVVVAAPAKAAAAGKFTNNAYIVRLAELPVVAYDGGIKGLQATQAGQGPEDRPEQPGGRQLQELPRVAPRRGARQRRRRQEALQLRLRVQRLRGGTDRGAGRQARGDAGRARGRPRTRRARSTRRRRRRFLGLSGSGRRLGDDRARRARTSSSASSTAASGRSSLSFSDRTGTNGNATQGRQARLPADSRLARQVRPGRSSSPRRNCNQKLIGAQYYNAGWGGNAGIDAQLPWEFNSPRDFGGHGTHTAIDRRRQRRRADHRRGGGVRHDQRHRAARAHRGLQGLLGDRRTAAAASATDSVAAIDQAVADGVDVINFSISGSQHQLPRPGRDRVPVRGRRGRVRRRFGRQQRPDHQHRGAPRPVAHHGGGRHAQPRRRRLGDARQRRHLQRRFGGNAGRPGAADRLDGGRPARRRSDRRRAVLRRSGQRRHAGARSGQGRRQDRRLRSRRQLRASTRAWRSRKPAASA